MNLLTYSMLMMFLSLVRTLLIMLSISRLFLMILQKLLLFVLISRKAPLFLMITIDIKRIFAIFWGLLTLFNTLHILVYLFL
ncbi:hypothetical protein MA16_Dca000629 [Dendrobium catenatum]|uniref:Uncharacterized protein n=1 Tax=Dendrobium catenatum TaxID=906689 RepID=A0A2I0WUE5_9ASPA|nr:hypothetical protein MA16_Dca000629 [Dendrobium catenatum]